VLATSREPLRLSGERVLVVPPADPADAVELFVHRARAVDPGFDAADVHDLLVDVCRRLDNLPLAIELAAARLRVLSVAQLADRLADRFRLLTSGRSADDRQGSLQAAVEWSVQTCSKPERVMWARTA
jgi:predicted ATPase